MDGRKTIALSLYGLAVVGSGMARYFGAEGGETGLIFGIVMGLISFTSAACFSLNKSILGIVLAWASIALVGGWFIYEALIKKGIAEAELRQLVIIGLSVATAIIVLTPNKIRPSRKSNLKGGKQKA